jgi:hypothetical protein
VPTATWYQLHARGPLAAVLSQWVTSAGHCSAGTCAAAPDLTLLEGPYEWWVRAWSPVGLSGWSLRTDFFVGPAVPPPLVTQVWPTGSITQTQPGYEWEVVYNASWYALSVAGPSGSLVNAWYPAEGVCDESTWSCVVTPTVTLENGQHTWYVKGWNPADHGLWGDMPFRVSGEQTLYLPLVLKVGEGPASTPTPEITPVPPPPSVDLEDDPPIEDEPLLPPEIDQQTGPPPEEVALPEGPAG